MCICIVIVTALTSCQSKNNNDERITNNLLCSTNDRIHIERLSDVETPYTLCYKNTDGSVSVYIFSSPISYRNENNELELIDTSLISVSEAIYKKMGYSLRTAKGEIICYFPKNQNDTPILIRDSNMQISIQPDNNYRGRYQKSVYVDIVGREHPALEYYVDTNITYKYIPTSAGITVNVVFNEKPQSNTLIFYIDEQQDMSYITLNNQDVVVLSENSPSVGIIRNSYLTDSNGLFSLSNPVKIERVDGKIKYTITLDETFLSNEEVSYPVSVSPSVELTTDNYRCATVYSDYPYSYLSNFSVIGKNDLWGKGELYSKHRINYFLKSYAQNVRSATYNYYSLGGNNEELSLEMYRLKGFWDASNMESNMPRLSDMLNRATITEEGIYDIDITEYIKSCIHDDTNNTENYGLVLSSNEEPQKLISNYNNALYKPFVRIDFYDIPWTFEKVD